MLLAELMEKPEQVNSTHTPMLKQVQSKYPYMQSIYLLLAKADESYIPKAAMYCDGNLLYRFAMTKVEERLAVKYNKELLEEKTIGKIETPKHLPGNDAHFLAEQKVEDTLIVDAVNKDFFAFEKELSTDIFTEPPIVEPIVPNEIDNNFVSKYDDDKLPYSFLWWLAKTRKEHEQVFRPYAQPSKPTKKVETKKDAEFQQQYVEHIFHIQTPFDVSDHLAEHPKTEGKSKKGAEIIERFLKIDPTIGAPKPEQINSENKAKKSAEDHYDLVTETLAKIYIEQMLYPKAIDTYKKLIFKYPEKSLYFADLIKSIEKKL